MKLSSIQVFVLVAAITNGILVGGGLDRALVGFPAWRVVGPQAWADFSRHADLAKGRFWYPLWAFAGMVCSVVAAVILYLNTSVDHHARIPVYAAALFATGGLLLTLKAAPIMLGLSRVGNDPDALEGAFNGFAFWSYLRLASQFLAWLANLGSLAILSTIRT